MVSSMQERSTEQILRDLQGIAGSSPMPSFGPWEGEIAVLIDGQGGVAFSWRENALATRRVGTDFAGAKVDLSPAEFLGLVQNDENMPIHLTEKLDERTLHPFIHLAQLIMGRMGMPASEVFAEPESLWREPRPKGEECIRTVSTFGESELAEADRRFLPTVCRGPGKWAPAQWTPAELVKRYGDCPMKFLRAEETSASDGSPSTIGGFLEEAQARASANEPYTSQSMTIPLDSEFGAELASRTTRKVSCIEAFITTKGAVTGLHRDGVGGIVSCFFGPRRFTLWSPGQGGHLHAHKFMFMDNNDCDVDPRASDVLARFPSFANAHAEELTLNPGDVFFLPAGWFHHVETLALSMLVKLYVSDPHDFGRNRNQMTFGGAS
jgi:hypothetical protein